MSKTTNYIIFAETDCISEKTMFDYIDHKLSPKECHQVEKHLLDCSLCSDALDGLALLKDRNKIGEINHRIAEQVKTSGGEETKVVRFNFKLVSAIAAGLLLLIGGVFFFQQFAGKQMEQNNIAELKQPTETSTPPVDEKNTAKLEQSEPASRADVSDKKETDNESAQKQRLVSKDEKINSALAQPDKTVSNITKEEATGKDVKTEVTTVTTTGDTRTILAENDKDVAGVKTKATEKEGTGAASAEYISAAPPASVAKQDLSKINANGKKQESKYKEKKNSLSQESAKQKEKSAGEQTAVAGYMADTPMAADEEKPMTTVSANERSVVTDSVYTNAETKPQFPGGDVAMYGYILKNYKYPVITNKNTLSGTKIIVSFTIDPLGKVTNSKIVKGINEELNTEALRVINSMPNWIPATSKGKAVSYPLTLPIQLEIK